LLNNIYPLKFTPVYKDYIWGGRNLEKIGRHLPKGTKVAESWEIAAHQDGTTCVENGPLSGMTLQAVFEMLQEDLVGRNSQWAIQRGKFPLLVKLIDAHQPLSVQVHPDDAYAMENEGNELGKTEMWIVLDAHPSTEIIYGLSKEISPESFRQLIAEGKLEDVLNRLPITAGDHICVPSGTLHAILEGTLILEIQQNSNTTYRVFDWNRVDGDGQPRQLHIPEALDVISFNQVRMRLPTPNKMLENKNLFYERLCQNAYFTTDRLTLEPDASYIGLCDGSTFEIWGVLSGTACIAGHVLREVSFVLLPAALGPFEVTALSKTQLIRTFVA
jgi:mannose-6-phosphate isomerase